MSFIADLHIHSYYSRATSQKLNLEHLQKWAQLKGVQVVATGDFCHPEWLEELQEKLVPAEEGLYQLKSEFARQTDQDVPGACKAPVRFILSTEICNIYKKNDRVRKIHNVILVPSFAAAKKIQTRLDRIANIASDGRPILGLDARNLLELVLETDAQACLIPAHIWTPWFSILGSNSGFDAIEECFDDLSSHIFAVETGLSSDPPMNWRVSALDKYTLISNSDAHSPEKLAREANLFNCAMSYPEMLRALKTGDPTLFGGTIEFFPEEGKYHLDGHRKCNVRLAPEETVACKGICPVCGKNVTLGVSYRIEMLADRKPGEKSKNPLPFLSQVALAEIIAEVQGVGANSKSVARKFDFLLAKLGNELTILREIPLSDIEKVGGSFLAEGIRRMRAGDLQIDAGYDGEYGTIHVFSDHERCRFQSQTALFAYEISNDNTEKQPDTKLVVKEETIPEYAANTSTPVTGSRSGNFLDPDALNDLQTQAVRTIGCNLLIVAGPGTGKTRTLTHRIAFLIQEQGVPPGEILAVTFTNKATEEMANRLVKRLGANMANAITIKTFHALGAFILRHEHTSLGYHANFTILTEADKLELLSQLAPHHAAKELRQAAETISETKNQLLTPDVVANQVEYCAIYQEYQQVLHQQQAFDFDDLIVQPILLFRKHPEILATYQNKFRWISVDEYQDLNHGQYQLLRQLVTSTTNLCVIGDPDQAIYGFRGADYRYFTRFEHEFAPVKVIFLEKNYRSDQFILDAAGQVIEKNPGRDNVKTWSGIASATKLEIYRTPTEKAEAETIVHQVEKLVGATSFFSVDSGRAGYDNPFYYSFADIAIFYRLNAQLVALEEAFRRSGIPYQTMGEIPFYQRKEVKDIISYLRVLHNPGSELDLLRILKIPPRGVGKQTIAALMRFKSAETGTLWQALFHLDEITFVSDSQKQSLNSLATTLTSLARQVDQLPLPALIKQLITAVGLASYYKDDDTRVLCWQKLIDQAENLQLSLTNFLEAITLQKETDAYDPTTEAVTLMTLHASKGLEFPVVFISGCEEGLVPYISKKDQKNDIDEERRLFYVGMTRAKQRLILTHAANRFLFGQKYQARPSRFLTDIEEALKEQRRSQTGRKKIQQVQEISDRQLSLF